MTEIGGQVYVTMRKADCYGGRRVNLRIGGLPGWLMALVAEAGPFTLEASSYGGTSSDDSGPYSMILGSARVVATTEPAPYLVPKEATETGGAER